MNNLLSQIQNSALPIDELSRKTGITVERIIAFLNGSSEPTMSDVRKFSKILNLSIDYLVSESDKYEDIKVLFRKSSEKKDKNSNSDKVSYLIGNSFALLTDTYEPDSRLFEYFPKVDNSFSNARLLAGLFRQIFYRNDFVSPILTLPEIISSNLKIILFVTDLGKEVDGASAIIKRVPFIFISPRFAPRMLFTLAHELCHILAHHKEESDFVTVDEELNAIARNRNKDEIFANAFASELLLPEEGVGITLKKIRQHLGISGALGDIEILYLSRIYGVSFEVAAKRCEDMDLLPSGGAVSIYEALKINHGSPEKRAKQLNIADRPEVNFPKISPALIQTAIEKVRLGEMSLGRASEILSIPVTDIVTFNSKN